MALAKVLVGTDCGTTGTGIDGTGTECETTCGGRIDAEAASF